MSQVVMMRRILIPTDFSAGAEAACSLGAGLAMQAQADLVLFHALPGVELLEELGRGRGRPQMQVLDDVRKQLRVWFETVVRVELRRSLTVGFHVRVGEPAPRIAWEAERNKADLILMATHGRTGLAHLFMGSVTEAVLRTVSVPVLAFRSGQEHRPLAAVQRILWATDLSPVSESAWRYALKLADIFGAEVVLLHVVRPPKLAGRAAHPVPPPEGWRERHVSSLQRELERRQQAIEALGLRARRKVLVGVPAEVIVAEAKAEQVDLIVVGTHGRSGLTHALLGSVAEAVIRTAPCPVLAVKVTRDSQGKERDVDGAAA